MKNQGLTTLAVMLAVALTAIVALVIVGESNTTASAADEPRVVQIGAASPEIEPAVAEVPEAPAAPAIDEVTDPVVEEPAVAEVPEAPAADDGLADEAPVEETPVEDEVPAEDEAPVEDEVPAEDETPVEDEVPAEDETPVEEPPVEDDEEPAGPTCSGKIINDICVSILCVPGFVWDAEADACVHVGCPNGSTLIGGTCQDLGLVPACGEGFITQADGTCLPDFGIAVPVGCNAGFTLVDGNCVTVCPPNHVFTNNGFCLPALVNPDVQLPNLDLTLGR